MNKTVTHGSLFAGIGGFDLGFQWAGIKTLWDVEIDSYCQKVLRKNFPDTEILSDVKEVGKHNLSPVDIISGGFPCQPWSVAGKQGGTEDDRNLWPEMFRVIGELHPRWVVAENVPNLDAMGYLDVAIDDLESIGYEVRPVEIPAAGVGAPHLRKRIWIVAYSGGIRQHKPEYSRKLVQSAKAKSEYEQEFDPDGVVGCGEDVADPSGQGLSISEQEVLPGARGRKERGTVTERSQVLADAGYPSGTPRGPVIHGGNSSEREGQTAGIEGQSSDCPWPGRPIKPRVGGMVDGVSPWLDEPDIPRVARGVKNRVDRLKGLGNAIMPQIAEIIGRLILQTIVPGETGW